MTIRYAKASDLPQIRNVWNICFPEDISFGGWFFENVWKADNTLLCFEGDTLAAMLQMLPTELVNGENKCKATYIYGAATTPEFRRRGLMAALLEASFSEDRKNGRPLSVLIPQEEWLFDFYRKFSYEPKFLICKKQSSASEAAGNVAVRPMTEADLEPFAVLYESRMGQRTHVKRSLDDSLLIFRYFAENGALALCAEAAGRMAAAAFGYVREKNLVLQELLVEDGFSYREILAQMCRFCSCTGADAWMLAEEGGRGVPFACARAAEWADVSFDWDKAYLNLLFN